MEINLQEPLEPLDLPTFGHSCNANLSHQHAVLSLLTETEKGTSCGRGKFHKAKKFVVIKISNFVFSISSLLFGIYSVPTPG